MTPEQKKFWDEVERTRPSSVNEMSQSFHEHMCPLCGQVISEGAWSGSRANFDRHLKACEAKKEQA